MKHFPLKIPKLENADYFKIHAQVNDHREITETAIKKVSNKLRPLQRYSLTVNNEVSENERNYFQKYNHYSV